VPVRHPVPIEEIDPSSTASARHPEMEEEYEFINQS